MQIKWHNIVCYLVEVELFTVYWIVYYNIIINSKILFLLLNSKICEVTGVEWWNAWRSSRDRHRLVRWPELSHAAALDSLLIICVDPETHERLYLLLTVSTLSPNIQTKLVYWSCLSGRRACRWHISYRVRNQRVINKNIF